MTTSILEKHSVDDFTIASLNASIDYMQTVLDTTDLTTEEFNIALDRIIAFQDEDGSFKLFDTVKIPSDARVEYVFEPTYICTAILIKCLLYGNQKQKKKVEQALPTALEFCCYRKLWGHGFDDIEGLCKALAVFVKCDVDRYVRKYLPRNNKFRIMIEQHKLYIRKCVENQEYSNEWGISYEDSIIQLFNYFYPNDMKVRVL